MLGARLRRWLSESLSSCDDSSELESLSLDSSLSEEMTTKMGGGDYSLRSTGFLSTSI